MGHLWRLRDYLAPRLGERLPRKEYADTHRGSAQHNVAIMSMFWGYWKDLDKTVFRAVDHDGVIMLEEPMSRWGSLLYLFVFRPMLRPVLVCFAFSHDIHTIDIYVCARKLRR